MANWLREIGAGFRMSYQFKAFAYGLFVGALIGAVAAYVYIGAILLK